MQPEFELKPHTADMALVVRATSLEELIEPLRLGFYELVGSVIPKNVAPKHKSPSRLTLSFASDSPGELLREFAAELLYLLEVKSLMAVSSCDPVFSDGRLVLSLEMAEVDTQASDLAREVKAVTYHGLSLERLVDEQDTSYLELHLLVDL